MIEIATSVVAVQLALVTSTVVEKSLTEIALRVAAEVDV
jgi:hypothetical protein